MTLSILYGIMFAMAAFNLLLFMIIRSRHNNFLYGILMMVAAISNGGYFFVSVSKTFGEAIAATKVAYIGGCFLPVLLLFCVLEICGIRIKWYLQALLVIIAGITYSFVLTIGQSELFMRHLVLANAKGLSSLQFYRGTMFQPFRIQIVLTFAVIIGICIYSFVRRKSVSYKNMIYLLVACLISVLCYFVGRAVLPQVNLVPSAFVVVGWIMLALQRRTAIYDVSSIVAESILNQGIYGYILLDRHKNFLGADPKAEEYFPQLDALHVDFSLPKDDPFFQKLIELMKTLDDTINLTVGYAEQNDQEYRIEVDYMKNAKGHHLGYYIELSNATEARQKERNLANYNEQLRRDVERETRHLKEVQDQILMGMANMIENRDTNTGGHIKRTSMGVKILVKEMMARDDWEDILNAKYCETMIKAAPLHDVGKIAVDDDILRKPGRFTPGEFEQMKMHAPKGAELLHSIIDGIEDEYFVRIAENMAHYHHERWNGTGYPDKLAGEEIPMEARVMAVADVYDALVSKRCYKDRMTYEEAAAIILDGMGTQFDPALKDVFETCRPRLERYYDMQLQAVEAAG